MEVPRSLHVRLNSGILETDDPRDSVEWTLFKHMHGSMNDKNNLEMLKGLAAHHGIEIATEENG